MACDDVVNKFSSSKNNVLVEKLYTIFYSMVREDGTKTVHSRTIYLISLGKFPAACGEKSCTVVTFLAKLRIPRPLAAG